MYWVLPETKDKSLEEVELLFMSAAERDQARKRMGIAGVGNQVEMVDRREDVNETSAKGGGADGSVRL